jgi:nucleotide-binding universal stress UspA family protein
MFKDILFAVDLADGAEQNKAQNKALEAATTYAKAGGAALHVLTIVPDFGMSIVASYFPENYEEKVLAEADKRLHDYVKANVPKGIKVQHIVGIGTIYREIIKQADKVGADLIVMASHRPELQDYLLGPNSSQVVRHAKQSVLVVRN